MTQPTQLTPPGVNTKKTIHHKASKTAISAKTAKDSAALLAASTESAEALLRQFDTTMDGYSHKKAQERLDHFGANSVSYDKPDPWYKKLFEAFVNPFTLVLFVLAAISLVTNVILADPDSRDPSTVIIIVVMVMISGILRFVQDQRSDKSVEALRKMVHTTTAVARGKKHGDVEIPLDDVVPGDIVSLAAGDMIPADMRILSCKDLFVSQSSLTGESEPVEKLAAPLTNEPLSPTASPLQQQTLAFLGSNVVSGTARGIVIATGDHTLFGSLAKSMQTKREETSFDKGINSVSKLLIRFTAVMAPVVFLIYGFAHGDWYQGLLFALSVAVGLTPEMLPMIVTTNLAKSAITMSHKKTIVRHMDSMQNFGAMNVLCTDKTGTITQDKVVLERYLNVFGDEDDRVLKHAFLNSYFQTGLRNLMDRAILAHSHNGELEELTRNYTKIDEIPFDFERRRMTVVIRDTSGKTQMVTKGATEEMLNICSYIDLKDHVEPIDDKRRQEILSTVKSLNAQGMRVLAIAQKTNPSLDHAFAVADESNMVLLGYLAFLDPPKDSAAHAIKALNEYGVGVKVLTGDNDAVTVNVAGQVGLDVSRVVLGSDIAGMDDKELSKTVEQASIFAKLSPADKARVVSTLRENGHVVGFMGDGINDTLAMHASDVAISVDTAVDIAKESADIILLQKDLMVLEGAVIEGRKTFGNIIKYIKMTVSSNFGNMLSVLVASLFLPFLPMQPIQVLLLNMIYDFSCIAIPWDRMDSDYVKVPRKWDASTITSFMFWLGPTSSVFDMVTFASMFFWLAPSMSGGPWAGAAASNAAMFIAVFNTGWFIESLWSQTLVIHMIRTPKIPFIQSCASMPLILSTTCAIIIGAIIPYTPLGPRLGLVPLPWIYAPWLAAVVIAYMLLTTVVKKLYIRKYGELL